MMGQQHNKGKRLDFQAFKMKLKEISKCKDFGEFEQIATSGKLQKGSHIVVKFINKETPAGNKNKENSIFLFGNSNAD